MWTISIAISCFVALATATGLLWLRARANRRAPPCDEPIEPMEWRRGCGESPEVED